MSKFRIIIVGVLASIFVGLLVFMFLSDRGDKQGTNVAKAQPKQFKNFDEAVSYFSEIQNPEAPPPSVEEQSKAIMLWPDLAQKSKVDKVEIQKQWVDFAAKYPENIFIPTEFKKRLTPAQEKEIRATADTVTGITAKMAATRSAAKYAEAGTAPKEPEKPEFTPAEQRTYVDYKLRELKSTHEIISYFLENGKPDAEQKVLADKELTQINNNIEQMKKLSSEIPK